VAGHCLLLIFTGACFVDFSEEMTIVYGKYCRNHDEAIAFLEKVLIELIIVQGIIDG
jgi:hypothetical protein